MSTKKLLSLFSGCGGMDIGFEGYFNVNKNLLNEFIYPEWLSERIEVNNIRLPKTKFKTVFANDIRPKAKILWDDFFTKNYQINQSPFHLESIVDLVRKHQNSEFRFPENIDIVTGGFPCQDFSLSGKRAGFNSNKDHLNNEVSSISDDSENRGFLYRWMKECIKITKPKMFVAENVKGLVSLKDIKVQIEKDLSKAGTGYLVLPGKLFHVGHFGIPQTRERVIFMGFLKSALKPNALIELSKTNISDEYSPYPIKTHYFEETKNEDLFKNKLIKKTPKCSTVLQDLLEPYSTNDLSQQYYSKAKWYGKHVQGQTEINLDGMAPTIRAEHHGNIEFRRLSAINGGKYKEELNNNLYERRLSVRECLRIQTFPDNFEGVLKFEENKKFTVSPSEAYKLVGNAVPPLFAFHIAKRLEHIWKKLFVI